MDIISSEITGILCKNILEFRTFFPMLPSAYENWRQIQGVAWGARAPLFFKLFLFFFLFAITVKNYKLCTSLINACKSLTMHY